MKEEILRAIKWLEPSKGNYDDWLHSHVWTSGKEFYHIIQIALTALQEQLDRLEGCEACNSDNKCNYCQGAVYAGYGECCCIDYEEFESNYYCDICGRKLRGGEDEV